MDWTLHEVTDEHAVLRSATGVGPYLEFRPDRYDIIGALICLLGVAVSCTARAARAHAADLVTPVTAGRWHGHGAPLPRSDSGATQDPPDRTWR
jgi:hypothetical protein